MSIKNNKMLAGTQEEVLNDFQSLLEQFDARIAELAQHTRQGKPSPDKNEVEGLNVLKLERMRIKQYLIEIDAMPEDQFPALKKKYKENYRTAKETLSQPSEAMA